MSKKTIVRKEKVRPNPPRPKFTSAANIFYKEKVTPLQTAYQQAMKIRNYDEANKNFLALMTALNQHRLYKHRREMVRVR